MIFLIFWQKEAPRDVKGIKLMSEDARGTKKYEGDIVGIVVLIFLKKKVFLNHKGCRGQTYQEKH
jgi:hypothetical protein